MEKTLKLRTDLSLLIGKETDYKRIGDQEDKVHILFLK